MTNSCEHYRSLIDNPQPSSEADQQDLEAHLTTCAECTEYRTYSSVTARLIDQVRDVVAEKPVDVAYQQLMARSGQEWRQTGIALTGAVTSLLALVWFTTQDGAVNAGTAILLMWFIGSAVYAWWTSGKARRFLSYNHSPEFLASWRKDVSQKIMLTSAVTAVVGLEIVIGLIVMLINGMPSDPMIPFGLGLVLGTGVLYALVIELPLLKRERSLLTERA